MAKIHRRMAHLHHLPKQALILLVLALLLSACNINAPEMISTPTVELLETATPSVTPSPSPTATMSVDDEVVVPVVVVTPPREDSDMAPTVELTPSPTLGPYEYVIQSGDTMFSILPQFGYRDLAVVDEIVRINPNISNPNILPVGQQMLIPRQTATPIPDGLEMTQTALANVGLQLEGNIALAQGTVRGCHTVVEDETLVEIADIYRTTLEILSQLNPTLNWSGCQFNIPSGGPNCGPSIREGQCINVPLPTPTPAPTNTLTGLETATPTPTYSAGRVVAPADGITLSAGRVTLHWVSVGMLRPDEAYLVEVIDQTINSEPWLQTTRSTSVLLPRELVPSSGQTHTINWRVSVVRVTDGADSQSVQVVGGIGDWNTFYWQSR